MDMMHYTLRAFSPETLEPVTETISASHDAAALDAGRELLPRCEVVQHVEIWRGGRRIATVDRVV
jgi:hypothetical protein